MEKEIEHTICRVEELPPGDRKIVTIDGRSIGIFNSNGQYYGVRNTCPHQGAELCTFGKVGGTLISAGPYEYVYGMEEHVIRCPWHGYEFDMTTGRSLFDPGYRVKTYTVTVEAGFLILRI